MNHKKIILVLFVLYIVGMTGVMIWQGIGIAPDRYAFVLLFASLLVRRTRSFLIDWIPFLFILISYDFLRGFADNVNTRVHVEELINLERQIFGFIPTVELQRLLYNPNSHSLLDFGATILYFLHFALPESFAFLLWIKNRRWFYEFTTALLLMSFAAWITYLVYPAAPPWLASQQGKLEHVYKIMDSTLNIFPEKINLPTIYHQLNPNPVAAIPSMHAAYPLLVFLFALAYFRRKALLFGLYVLAMWFSIVYLGEHYVIDIIPGAIYAILFFILAKGVIFRVKLRLWQKKMLVKTSD